MPPLGEQHLQSGGRAIINPFEEVKPRISEYTAQEIATLQARLSKQLGPEYLSTRSGPGGQKVHYISADKYIQLANEVFGFNGWSSQIMQVQVDFVEENPSTGKIDLGLSVIVRVTLRDGTFHEDLGYGHIENCKGKAAAFEKAKKEGTTDALKRALRSFGNVLGNCLYDKDYLGKITKIKVQPMNWSAENLHRHPGYEQPVNLKKEIVNPLVSRDPGLPKENTTVKPQAQSSVQVQLPREIQQSISAGISISTDDTFDDEYGDFDEADFSVPDPDCNPDDTIVTFGQQDSYNPDDTRNNNVKAQPQTPRAGFARATSGGNAGVNTSLAENAEKVLPQIEQQQSGQNPNLLLQNNQNPTSGPPINSPRITTDGNKAGVMIPQTVGFFSAKAVDMLPNVHPTDATNSNHVQLPSFNPHAESPSIRKTPGVNHNTSKPVGKDLKHVSSVTQSGSSPALATNVVNPHLSAARRIGAPGGLSPLSNRSAYKPPSLKRPIDSTGGIVNNTRQPLLDLQTNEAISGHNHNSEIKRQRTNN